MFKSGIMFNCDYFIHRLPQVTFVLPLPLDPGCAKENAKIIIRHTEKKHIVLG